MWLPKLIGESVPQDTGTKLRYFVLRYIICMLRPALIKNIPLSSFLDEARPLKMLNLQVHSYTHGLLTSANAAASVRNNF